jgi:hypothetical protein
MSSPGQITPSSISFASPMPPFRRRWGKSRVNDESVCAYASHERPPDERFWTLTKNGSPARFFDQFAGWSK